MDSLRHVDPTSKELLYNPKAEELFAPTLGPECPFKSGQQKAHRNTLAGYVEPAHMSEFQFEAQRKTFTSFGKLVKSSILAAASYCWLCAVGYALDPTVGLSTNEGNSYVGDVESAESKAGRTVFENPNKPDPSKAVKRKLEKNDDSADVEGYKGPWAPYENECRLSRPSEVCIKI